MSNVHFDTESGITHNDAGEVLTPRRGRRAAERPSKARKARTPGKGWKVGFWLVLSLFALFLLGQDRAGALYPCKTEDSTHCYWDAQTRGNGEGNDFVSLAP